MNTHKQSSFINKRCVLTRRAAMLIATFLTSLSASAGAINKKTIDYSHLDYIFICSTFPAINARTVSYFYTKNFEKSRKIKFLDGPPIEKIESNKYYLIVTFSAAPVSQKIIDCLKSLPEISRKWISEIKNQSDEIGTVPDYLRNLPNGGAFGRIQKSTTFRHTDHPNIFLSSTIALDSRKYNVCSFLATAFIIDHDSPRSELKCYTSEAEYE